MQLTTHFSLAELTHSDTAVARGVDNNPPVYLFANLNTLANGLEEVRALLGNKPMRINSAYRSPTLNKMIGSKPTSQHVTGCAADFTCEAFGTPHEIVEKIVSSGVPYDQVIAENFLHASWVHISFSDRNRRQALIIDEQGTRGFA